MANLEYGKNTTNLIQFARNALPLYSHKLESDRLGKHDEWSPLAHKVAEIAAVGVDIGFEAFVGIYLAFINHEITTAVMVEMGYLAAIDIVPDQIARLGKRFRRQSLGL